MHTCALGHTCCRCRTPCLEVLHSKLGSWFALHHPFCVRLGGLAVVVQLLPSSVLLIVSAAVVR